MEFLAYTENCLNKNINTSKNCGAGCILSHVENKYILLSKYMH